MFFFNVINMFFFTSIKPIIFIFIFIQNQNQKIYKKGDVSSIHTTLNTVL